MDVLIRARVSDDGRTISVAPGVELRADESMIVTDVPVAPEGMPLACIMFFETAHDMAEFAELFADDGGVHVREL
jgi:hypothetical protein